MFLMPSYFTLELDTTGPIIQINAPSYTSRESDNIITVVGNEKLSDIQDIYIVDSQGTRHDVIFSFDGNNTFTGDVVFNGYPVGVSTIFAQLQDEVGNPSNLATAHISVITSTYYSLFKLTMSEEVRSETMAVARTNNITVNEKGRAKIISEQKKQVIMTEQKRIVTVSDTN
jgi:hypothetical protein